MTQGKHYDDVQSMRKKNAMFRTAAVSAATAISKAGKLGERSSPWDRPRAHQRLLAVVGATSKKGAKSALV